MSERIQRVTVVGLGLAAVYGLSLGLLLHMIPPPGAALPDAQVAAWHGLFVFWCPVGLFGVWIVATAHLLLKALAAQRADAEREPAPTG